MYNKKQTGTCTAKFQYIFPIHKGTGSNYIPILFHKLHT